MRKKVCNTLTVTEVWMIGAIQLYQPWQTRQQAFSDSWNVSQHYYLFCETLIQQTLTLKLKSPVTSSYDTKCEVMTQHISALLSDVTASFNHIYATYWRYLENKRIRHVRMLQQTSNLSCCASEGCNFVTAFLLQRQWSGLIQYHSETSLVLLKRKQPL